MTIDSVFIGSRPVSSSGGARSAGEGTQGRDDAPRGVGVEVRTHRQTEHRIGQILGAWKLPSPPAAIRIDCREMRGNRVMNQRLDTRLAQMLLEPFALRMADDKQVPHR